MTNYDNLKNAYENVKVTCKKGLMLKAAGDSILNLVILSMKFLEKESDFIDLVSLVPGKKYNSYKRNEVVTRPANRSFYTRDIEKVISLWRKWEKDSIKQEEFSAMTYTIALAPCLALELLDRQNKKGPATYFECLIGHIFAKTFGVEPTKGISFSINGKNVRMTMDFLFKLGNGKTNIHLPVKMSTRERVVQAWSHQRLLDAYSKGIYKGVMVLFSETKMDSKKLEVVEICVPDQWLIYQKFLARLDKIYYFDVPERYQVLTNEFPEIIEIKQFGEFFNQIESIVHQ
jgi:hypothetical protein